MELKLKHRSAYHFEPLASPGTQIRLFELFPGRGRIKGRFTTVVLADAQGTFEPISYCWQKYRNREKDKKVPILIGDASLLVSESLHDVLIRTRLPGQSSYRTVWADAICINQSDLAEKRDQIPLMGQIYENGYQTLLWLGTANILTWLAFRYIRKWKQQAAEEKQLSSNDINRNAVIFVPAVKYGMLERKYFTRGWVVQEVAMSKRISVLCGDHTVDWDDLCQSLDARRMHFAAALDFGSNLVFHQMQSLRNQRPRTKSLIEVMIDLSKTQLTDPRDKLYSVLGLVPEHLMLVPILPDYTQDTAEVFYDFTKRTLLAGGPLTVLSMCYGVSSISQASKNTLPSWVWNPDSEFPFDRPSQRIGHVPFKATQDSRPSLSFDGYILRLQGYTLDTIEDVSCVYDANGDYVRYNSWGPSQVLHMMECYFSWRAVAGLDIDLADVNATERRREIFQRDIEPLVSLYREVYDGRLDINDNFDNVQPVISHPSSDEVAELFLSVDQQLVRRFGRHISKSKKLPAFWTRAKVWASSFGCVWDQRRDPIAMTILGFPPKLFWTRGRCLVRSENGLLCLCPKDTQIGDKVALLQGSNVPHILRPVANDQYVLVGECVASKLMYGQAWDELQCKALLIK